MTAKKGFLLAIALGMAAAGYSQGIIVSAAASLTDVLTALKSQAETAIGGAVSYNFGGSGTLRRQIEEGAPVDVFFSAAAEDMDRLEKGGLIAPGSRHDVLSNALVIIGDTGAPVSGIDALRDLLAKTEFLAIGNPDVVPAGRYAVQALTAAGLYPLVERKLVLGGTVREVLQYVESGSAALGVVFVTDALSVKPGSPVRQLFQFPESALKTPVLYPVAVVSASKSKSLAEKMVAFLQGDAAKRAFRAAGFVVKL